MQSSSRDHWCGCSRCNVHRAAGSKLGRQSRRVDPRTCHQHVKELGPVVCCCKRVPGLATGGDGYEGSWVVKAACGDAGAAK